MPLCSQFGSPSTLCENTLESDRGKFVAPLSSGSHQPPRPPTVGAAGLLVLNDHSPLTLSTLGRSFSGQVDDSRMPLDEAAASARRDVEHLVTAQFASVHGALISANQKQPQLSASARVALAQLLAALLNSDYAPLHVQVHCMGTMAEVVVS